MSYVKHTWQTGETIEADNLNHMEAGIESVDTAVASVLPAVSGSDNGKVLTVVNGEWGAKTPSGGGGGSGAFVVTFDIVNDGGFVVTCDKTASEIISAYSDGLVCASTSFFGEAIYRHTFDVVVDADTNYIEFNGIYVINDADEEHNGLLLNYSIVWNSESEMWNVDAFQYPLTPLSE